VGGGPRVQLIALDKINAVTSIKINKIVRDHLSKASHNMLSKSHSGKSVISLGKGGGSINMQKSKLINEGSSYGQTDGDTKKNALINYG
jgi:hypothetical protein